MTEDIRSRSRQAMRRLSGRGGLVSPASAVMGLARAVVFVVALLVLLGESNVSLATALVVTYLAIAFVARSMRPFENAALLIFFATFSFFLLNGLWITALTSKTAFVETLSTVAARHTVLVLLLSLAAVDVAYAMTPVRSLDLQREPVHVGQNPSMASATAKISGQLFVGSLLIHAVGQMAKVLHVQRNGYLSLYTSYTPPIPFVFGAAGIVSSVSLAIYLASRPNRRQVRWALLAYFVVAALSLGYGQRNQVMLAGLFVLFYLIVRERESPTSGAWLSKRLIVSVLVAVPFILSALYTFGFDRLDLTYDNADASGPIVGLLESQSATVALIPNAFAIDDALAAYGPYVFSPILDAIAGNSVFSAILGPAVGDAAGPVPGRSGEVLTFLLAPNTYSRGGGLGSSYVVELFQDYGYIGVIIGSALFGMILATSRELRGRSTVFAVLLVLIPGIWYAPREPYLAFFAPLVSPATLLVALVIWVIAGGSRARSLPSRTSLRKQGA